MKAMMRKIVTMALVVVLTAGVAIAGTMAYLTDRDSMANVFTVGDVEIELNEDFEQGATLVPGVNIEKVPTITNTGKNDAWVWMTFAIPAALDHWNPASDEGSNNNTIHWNPLGATAEGYVNETRVANAIAAGYLPEGMTADYITSNNMTWDVFNELVNGGNAFQTSIGEGEDAKTYNVYVLPYNKALEPGETTLPSIYNVFLDAHIDIDPNGDWHRVENGVVTSFDWNTNEDGAPVLYISAYAIQAEGFATVDEAYAAYAAQWADNGTEYADVTVASPDSGAVRPAGYAPATEGETIDGLIIMDGSDDETNLRALYKNGLTGDLIVKNSVLDGTYAMNVTAIEEEDVDLVVENTTFMGWTSYSGFDSVSFTDCTFKLNSEGTYNFVRAYDNTTFTNCEFAGTELDLADSMVEKEGTVTLINCTYNGTLITDENVADLLYQDAEAFLVIISKN